VPDAHDGAIPVPLWVYLHSSYGSMEQGISYVGHAADEHGFVLASPQDLPGGQWNRGTDDTELDLSLANPDIAFIDALIDHLGSELCIDLARVYAAGYSNGGEAVNVLACVLEDRIAATGAAASGPLDLGDDCDLTRPVPFLYIHGAADLSRPLEGGLTGQPIKDLYGAGRPIPDRIGSMAVRNGCEAGSIVEVLSEGVDRLSWTCPAEGEVGLVIIDGWGHSWPRPSIARGVDAGQMLWEFFEQHPMPE
jgi:polyhydroxybutyrate depolymerase